MTEDVKAWELVLDSFDRALALNVGDPTRACLVRCRSLVAGLIGSHVLRLLPGADA